MRTKDEPFTSEAAGAATAVAEQESAETAPSHTELSDVVCSDEQDDASLRSIVLPLGLIFVATCCATTLAYGLHPDLGGYSWGLEAMILVRRVQWLLVIGAVVFSLAVAALVISGTRRAWWLLGLAPVLALFVHRFATDPLIGHAPIDAPLFAMTADAQFLKDDDYVVGLEFKGIDYAFPYAVLFEHPLVFHADHDDRLILMWSPYANRAIAAEITREIRPRDIEIVSMPANALLLYNRRIGQFINGLTGKSVAEGLPTGFRGEVATCRMTWGDWRKAHPSSRVLLPPTGIYVAARSKPVGPRFDVPVHGEVPPHVSVTVISTPTPVAVVTEKITSKPLNLMAGDMPVLIFRDPETKQIRAFERRIDEDLMPRFELNDSPDRADAAFVDSDTNSGWNAAGVVVDGSREMKGKRLAPLIVDEHLYWDVMKFWYPEMKLVSGKE